MRLQISWFAWLFALWLALWPGRRLWERLDHQLTPGSWTEKLREDATRCTSFVLPRDRYVAITLPRKRGDIRLLTNAALPYSVATNKSERLETERWTYAIEYQFQDSHGEVLTSGQYHFRTNCLLYQDRRSGELFTNTFFASRLVIPASMRPMVIGEARIPTDAARLQLRLLQSHNDIQDITVRAYAPLDEAERKVQKWNRLSPEKRKQLSRANVYPSVLLRDAERERLMDSQWTLLLPDGVAGADYEPRTLYTLKLNTGQLIYDMALPAGLPVAKGMRGIVPVPTGPGAAKLRFNTRPTYLSRTRNLTVLYHRGQNSAPESSTVAIDSARDREFTIPANGGILEIVAPFEVSIEAFWKGQETAEWMEITPCPETLSQYELQPKTNVTYSLAHLNGLPTPIKLCLRRPSVTEPSVVEWELLDPNRVVVAAGTITMNEYVSRFDRRVQNADLAPTSEPVNRFFDVTTDIAYLRIRAVRGNVLVATYSRPQELPVHRTVPHDYSAYERSLSDNNTWFLMWPTELSEGLQTVSVSTQPRPPKTRDDIIAGRFEWEDFLPVGARPAMEALVARNAALPVRPELLPFTYNRIRSGHEFSIATVTHERAGPRLYFRANHSPQTLRVMAGSQLLSTHTLHANHGSIRLADVETQEVDTSSIRIDVDDPNTELFVNRVSLAQSDPTYVKRLLHPIDPGETLTFHYKRSFEPNELVTLKFFPSSGQKPSSTAPVHTRLQISLLAKRVESNQAFSTWTHLERTVDVNFTPNNQAEAVPIVLASNDEQIAPGQPIFLPIGEDIAEASFPIQIRLLNGNRGYVSLYQLRQELKFDSKVSVE
ncbi:MAG: hypothetical protein KDB27_30725 [Planctomycetales bacterium]|nr:hypothetical protein [Planctomycetales bacterium]